MKTQFYDLSIETLDDGTIRLEQRDYCGESVIVDMHTAQVLGQPLLLRPLFSVLTC